MNSSAVGHIEFRHGKKGQADKSVANDEDVARIQYVLDNYDSVSQLKKLSKEFKNLDGSRSKMVEYKKRINVGYYVIEAVPDSEKRTVHIVSAYRSGFNKKSGGWQVSDANIKTTPNGTSNNELTSPSTSTSTNTSVPNSTQNSNSYSQNRMFEISYYNIVEDVPSAGPHLGNETKIKQSAETSSTMNIEEMLTLVKGENTKYLPADHPNSPQTSGKQPHDVFGTIRTAVSTGVSNEIISRTIDMGKRLNTKIEFFEDVAEFVQESKMFESQESINKLCKENPIIVMQSKIIGSRIVVVGEVNDIYGKPVLAVLELSPKGRDGVVMNDFKIASTYSKTETEGGIGNRELTAKENMQNFINSSDILYVDPNKKRTNTWLKGTGLSLPVAITKYGIIKTISPNNSTVKLNVRNTSKNIPNTTVGEAFKKALNEKAQNSYEITPPDAT